MSDQNIMDTTSIDGKILDFSIEDQVYGIEIENVIEIIGVQPVTIVPKIPSYVKGIINLRGKIIPVMDVRTRFGKLEREYDERTCFIVIENDDISVGLIVDRVLEVINTSEKNITPVPDFNTVNSNQFVKNIVRIDGRVTLILDAVKLVGASNLGGFDIEL